MNYQLTEITAPDAEPLDWAADVKPGLRLSDESEKSWIMDVLVPAARARALAKSQRALITTTLEMRLGGFPPSGWGFAIRRPPLQAIGSVKYVDGDGVLQTWDSSLWQTEDPLPSGEVAAHARLWPTFGESYPTTRRQPDAVRITFTCGYGDAASDVPGGLRIGMLLIVNDKFLHREASIDGPISEIPMGADDALGMYLAEAPLLCRV